MNPMPLLLALLMLAYIGNLYASKRRNPAVGSASGVEFVVLGALLGPQALGALSRDAVLAFDPITLVVLGWIGLGYGIEWGMNGERRASVGRVLLGCLLTVMVAFAVGAAVFFAGSTWHWLPQEQLRLVAFAVALVSAETTRHAVRWISDRRSVSGPLAGLLGDVAAADDAPVIIGLTALLASHSGPMQVFERELPLWGSALGTLGIGVVLGSVCSYLTCRDPSTVMRWSVLLGCAWLTTGATTGIGLSAMGATFAMGLVISLTSPIARELRTQILATEGALRLPALLLAGARLEPLHAGSEGLLLGVALLARTAASCSLGTLIGLTRPNWRPAAPWLGLAMTSSGALTMMIGLAFSVRLGGDVGRLALTAAALFTLVGEVTGPRALARALDRAGELKAPALAPDLQTAAQLEATP